MNIIRGGNFGNCVDYVTRRTLEEKPHDEQSNRQKSDERKYEPSVTIGNNPVRGSAAIIDHLSKDWQLLAATTDVRVYEGCKVMGDDIANVYITPSVTDQGSLLTYYIRTV